MKIDLDEIGDGAMQDAVGDVAGGAAEEKGEASSMKRADIVAGDEQPSNDSDDDEGAADEKYAQGGRGETGEKTEGDAGITGINEIEEIVNDRVREAVSGAGFDPRFCGAVEEDDGESDPEEAEAVGKSHEVKEEKEEEEVKETGEVNILGHRDACRSVAFDFGEGFRAALADLRVTRVFADMSGVVPAAIAFGAIGAVDLDGKLGQRFDLDGAGNGRRLNFNLRNDE